MLKTFNPTAFKNKIDVILRKLDTSTSPHPEADVVNTDKPEKGLKEKLIVTTNKLHKAVEMNRKAARYWKRFQKKYPILSKTIMAIASIYLVLGSAYALITFGNRLVTLAIAILTVVELYATPVIIGVSVAACITIVAIITIELLLVPQLKQPNITLE